jgi:hypothetical protein
MMMKIVSRGPRSALLVSMALACLVPSGSLAQAPATAAATAPAQTRLKAEQIDQMMAPIALYPDALLAQILMASTYPFEIVQAARWLKANPGKTGKALEDALQTQTWDPSVKSLVAIPKVLQMMDEKLDWVQQMGDAFLAQREAVMDSVQRLRAKASAAGKVQTTKEQKVSTQVVSGKTVIVIEPANPQTVYVPVYNPAVVYGAWPYPAYPPYPYYPPGYVVGSALAFTAGVAVGAALWGNCNWGSNNVNVNVNNFNSFNRTNISNNNWQHDAGHRQGVPYRDPGVAQQFGRGQIDAASRDAFRGKTNADLGNVRGSQPADRGGIGAADRSSLGGGRAGDGRAGAAGARPAAAPNVGAGGGRDNAFANVDRGGAARANADRGRESFGGGGARQAGGASPRGGAAPGGSGRAAPGGGGRAAAGGGARRR